MNAAFATLFGVENALDGVQLSGMTDKIIFKNACKKTGIRFSEAKHQEFMHHYFRLLAEEVKKPGDGKKAVLPGVKPLLEALSRDTTVALGLLTGNYAHSAWVKLAEFGIDGYFAFGAYGDDHEDRNQLLPFALDRYREIHRGNGAIDTVWVIGDTPKDVACARPYGAKSLAVATGEYTLAELAQSKPDALVPDLRNVQRVMKILKGYRMDGNNSTRSRVYNVEFTDE